MRTPCRFAVPALLSCLLLATPPPSAAGQANAASEGGVSDEGPDRLELPARFANPREGGQEQIIPLDALLEPVPLEPPEPRLIRSSSGRSKWLAIGGGAAAAIILGILAGNGAPGAVSLTPSDPAPEPGAFPTPFGGVTIEPAPMPPVIPAPPADVRIDPSPTDTRIDPSPTDTRIDPSPTDAPIDPSPTSVPIDPSPAIGGDSAERERGKDDSRERGDGKENDKGGKPKDRD